jgi:site-specific DNA-methyltransferase (adenine-specific)
MAMQQLRFRILNDVIWEKPAPPPNLGCRCFTHASEILVWATKAQKGGTARYTFHYEEMKAENGGKQMKNVWRFSPPRDVEKRHGKHPTQKPIDLISRCLRASTDKGQLVLDPFTGSGSTGVAALQLGRRFIGVEREDGYATIATKRLKDVTHGEVRESDGPDASATNSREGQRGLFGWAQ